MSHFSDALKTLRKERNLTQEKLGELLGISKSSVNMYERGEREPSFNILYKIATFFNVDMNYLLGNPIGLDLFEIGSHDSLLELQKKEALEMNMSVNELLHALAVFSGSRYQHKVPSSVSESGKIKDHFNFFVRLSGLSEKEFEDLLAFIKQLEESRK